MNGEGLYLLLEGLLGGQTRRFGFLTCCLLFSQTFGFCKSCLLSGQTLCLGFLTCSLFTCSLLGGQTRRFLIYRR